MKLWCEWDDFQAPIGIEVLGPTKHSLATSSLENIEIYVPKYMAGHEALEVIPAMKNLKILQLPTAGYEEALQYWRPGVTICNAAGVHSTATAELAIGLAIAAQRGFRQFALDQEVGRWNHQRFPTLADCKVAIIGYGDIGRAIAARLANFEVEVIAYSKSGREGSLPIQNLDSELPSFDIVILIAPLTEETKGLFGRDRLKLMKDGALLVNVARGQLVDTDALLVELESGRLRAALDVTDPEPLPTNHPLWRAPNCIITPHVGGDTMAFEPRFKALLKSQLELLIAGKTLRNIVKC